MLSAKKFLARQHSSSMGSRIGDSTDELGDNQSPKKLHNL
jgi:hypothetical protein